jgi:acetyl-CoA carboxylase biotin carboxyl carrier protein
MAENKLDKDLIRDLAALLKETELSELELEHEGFRIRVSRALPAGWVAQTEPQKPRPQASAHAEPAATPGSLADPARHPGCVPSPMVGTAYLAPEPGAPPFVEVGTSVSAGQTILIVEAMKHMNEVAAPRAGRVVEILVEDGQPVEYGEPLMIIE